MENILNNEKSETILLEEIQLGDVLVMADTMVSVCDIGDEEGTPITMQELNDNIVTHWKKGNLAILCYIDKDSKYLLFKIYDKKLFIIIKYLKK